MKLPSLLGKLPKHKEFQYTPRVYSPEKENIELRARLAKIEREEPQENKISFREERQKYNASVNRLRLIIGGVILAILIAYLSL